MLWFFESFFPVTWIVFLVYWQIRAAGTKTTQRLEPAASRILRAHAFPIVIVLLSKTRIHLLWLYRQLWPSGIWPFWIGAAVTVAGLHFARASAVCYGVYTRFAEKDSAFDEPPPIHANIFDDWTGSGRRDDWMRSACPSTSGATAWSTPESHQCGPVELRHRACDRPRDGKSELRSFSRLAPPR